MKGRESIIIKMTISFPIIYIMRLIATQTPSNTQASENKLPYAKTGSRYLP